MITRIWSGYSPIYLLLIPLSWLYIFVTALIRYSYRHGWRKVHHFSLPIVVIGNLTIGGNGKTPLVIWLVKKLQERKWRVGVVSRGYRGRAKHYPLILNDTTNSEQCGDEPLLIRQKTGVPVAVAPQRIKAVAALLREETLDILISDDGLQHYALGRDIEWVVIDGKRRFENGWRLPAGPMREQVNRLRESQAIIINGGEKRPGEILMQLKHGSAINLLNGEQRELDSLKPIVIMAGIAHPSRFFAMIRERGITPLREITFNDHQNYKQKMLDALTTPNEQLIMTEKDAVKCRSFARSNWWYLPVDAHLPLSAEKNLLQQVEQAILYYKAISRESGKT